MADTKIEWATHVWNPTTGCDRVSSGCDNCYALTMAKRLKGMGAEKYQRDGDPKTSGPGFGVSEHRGTLNEPFGWRKPRRVFVNSMSDLFHESVSENFIAQVFATMASTPKHTYMILTKRHARMRSLLRKWAPVTGVTPWVHIGPWPLPNVWLGVSVEDQRWADIRVPALLETPAAVRFLSCEPLLGPVDLWGPVDQYGGRPKLTYWLDGRPGWGPEETTETGLVTQPLTVGPRIDWVIVGGESGPGARPMHPDWARTIRDQCAHSGVSFHFKQWGEYIPESLGAQVITRHTAKTAQYADLKGGHRPANIGARNGAATCHRVGKKAAGRELDGRTWDEFPTVHAAAVVA
ncbi:phage Gp37/Gp68 family protein [Streptosporangium sp. NBC_01755]|uniref:DUF5131 family protein n=1 Tax=Streptosporangium sp. NBC_01755 TaxID=2975949 RepID=UPI002DDB0B63|nr:phage Gp37/Gp68 family protein [Streptosporangium sp. NBC_01755]WSD03801.1 phage Gp37/Gp68 family protein [Streptosporangium sp. NBC_01755]